MEEVKGRENEREKRGTKGRRQGDGGNEMGAGWSWAKREGEGEREREKAKEEGEWAMRRKKKGKMKEWRKGVGERGRGGLPRLGTSEGIHQAAWPPYLHQTTIFLL